MVDTEFTAITGERPVPVCLVAYELRSGRRFRIFQDQFRPAPPYATGPDVLFVAYYASAELGCYRALGWPMPERILDLYVEFRNLTNGLHKPAGAGLLGALVYFGLDAMDAVEKKEMQEAIGNGTWPGALHAGRNLGLLRAGRGCARSPVACACCRALICPEPCCGGATWPPPLPWNTTARRSTPTCWTRLRHGWTEIQDQLIAAIDVDYGVYDGRTFKADRFAGWLAVNSIPWPLLESGRLNLSDEAFRQQAKAYPIVAPLRELRSSLADLRLNDLAVGRDGRNRCLLSSFGARSGRNTPSNTKFIFGPSVWLRGLIKPPPGYGVAYVDWSQQEIGIAAALSGDAAMLRSLRLRRRVHGLRQTGRRRSAGCHQRNAWCRSVNCSNSAH